MGPNADDHSSYIWAAAILMICLSTIALIFRTFLKHRKFDSSDASILFAQFLAIAQFGAIAYGLEQGLGKSLDQLKDEQQQQQDIEIVSSAATILFVLCLGAIKISLVLALYQPFRKARCARPMRLCRILIAIASIWAIGSAVVLPLRCDMNYLMPNALAQTCSDANWRLTFVLIFHCVTETAIFGLAVCLVQVLKVTLFIASTSTAIFSLRLLLVVLAIFDYRARSFAMLSDTSSSAYASPSVWQEIEICVSLVTATLPLALCFIRNCDDCCFSTFGTMQTLDLDLDGARNLNTRAAEEKKEPHVDIKEISSATSDCTSEHVKYSLSIYSVPTDAESRRSCTSEDLEHGPVVVAR